MRGSTGSPCGSWVDFSMREGGAPWTHYHGRRVCSLKPAHISVIRGPRVKPEDDPRTHGKEAQLFRCSRGIPVKSLFNDEHSSRSSWIRSGYGEMAALLSRGSSGQARG